MKVQTLFWLSIFTCSMGAAQLKEVKTGVYKWDELSKKESAERIGYKILEGYSTHLSFLEIHATTQQKGAKPSKPHVQDSIEELIIIKEGKMKMSIDGKSEILETGSAILIPPLTEQSMENVGDGPMTYYVIMFTAKKPMDIERSKKAGHTLFLDSKKLTTKKTKKGGRISYFDRPSAMYKKFEMHATHLDLGGPSYNPHNHLDTEIVIVIEGQTEMIINGEKYKGKAGDLYFIKSNEFHGISNLLDESCRYFAIRWY